MITENIQDMRGLYDRQNYRFIQPILLSVYGVVQWIRTGVSIRCYCCGLSGNIYGDCIFHVVKNIEKIKKILNILQRSQIHW